MEGLKRFKCVLADIISGRHEVLDVLVDIDNGNGSNGKPYIDEDGNELRLDLDTDESGVAIVNISIRQRNTSMLSI